MINIYDTRIVFDSPKDIVEKNTFKNIFVSVIFYARGKLHVKSEDKRYRD